MNINVDIAVDFLWGDEHFVKNEWGDITYIVGANGTGKSIVAEKLKNIFRNNGLSVRYFGAERINSLASKWDNRGFLPGDNLRRGLDIGNFEQYKERADVLGQSMDALIELRNKLDLQIRIESILLDVFKKQIIFEETGGFLNVKLLESGEVYDLKSSESHGLKEIITLLAFLYDDEYDCIILDEPELNLHPQFQQFVLQEIKKLSGNPQEDPGKKMFVILTHSPYMLSVQDSEDLKNVIVFHKNELPTYIFDYTQLESYQKERLDKLLLRMNVNHKTFFFADKPVFVEGYIDQQFYTTIQYKRGVPLGAIGVSIIDVGGKDEVELMYSLCRLLKINAYCIADLDALFGGKLRQTADRIDETSHYLAEKGRRPLMQEIGGIESLINDVVAELLSIDSARIPEGELTVLIDTLRAQTGENKVKMKQRIFAIGMKRITEQLQAVLSCESERKITQVLAIERDIFDCLKKVNIFVLEKGEIENYYITPIENHYQISDSSKTEYYSRESRVAESMTVEVMESNYREIIVILDKICESIEINTEKVLSKKIGNWIHAVQSVLRSNPKITVEQLISYPEVNWESYKRVIEIINLNWTDHSYSCKFKILRSLVKDTEKNYSFDGNTVAANFNA